MEDLVNRLPTVLKNIVADYTFHTLHREQISETLHNIKIRGIIDNERILRIFTDLSVEDDKKYIQICNTCTCCPRHSKNRPESLYPKDHKSYVMTIYKGLELYKPNKHHICKCMCRHVSRNIIRVHDPFGYNEYFDYRAFFIYNYNNVIMYLTDLKDIFQTISSSSQESYLPLVNMLRRVKQNKVKLDKRLIKLHTSLRNITPHSSSPLIDYKDTPNLHHKYIHLCDDTHELLYDIKAYFRTKDANDITREVLQLCNL